jgi:hypothetical protein
MKSQGTTEDVSVTFRNRTNRPLQLFWITYDGKRQLYGTVEPRVPWVQATFAGHVWVLADAAGNCKELVLIQKGVGNVVVQ